MNGQEQSLSLFTLRFELKEKLAQYDAATKSHKPDAILLKLYRELKEIQLTITKALAKDRQ
jgi:hypothetical protein